MFNGVKMDYIINTISEYYHNQQKGNKDKEEVKKNRFLALLISLFPDEKSAINKYVSGHETSICIKDKLGTGRIDAFYGNLVVEFERDLTNKTKFDEGLLQLCEYVSGLWNEEGSDKRNYICILTDGIIWKTYYPNVITKNNKLGPGDIELIPKESIILNKNEEKYFYEFYNFIDRHFFRDTRLKPSIDAFRRDFGLESYLFEKVSKELESIYITCELDSEVKTAYNQWSHYLTYTYGSIETNHNLFIRHSYLSMLARCIVAEALFPKDTGTGSYELIRDLLSGKFFVQKKILNLVDMDFFHWMNHTTIIKHMERTWLTLINQLKTYDFSTVGEDILKGVYQELVDPKDRHDLGEYYTPDWLCEKIVRHLFKSKLTKLNKGDVPSFLDPTCGSGSFIRQAIIIMREIILEKKGKLVDWDKFLSRIVNNVIGIDIHPLAVTITKANYILALKDVILRVKKGISIPIYLADSLFMPQSEENEGDLFGDNKKTVMLSFQGKQYSFPNSVFSDTGLYDSMIRLAAEFGTNLAADPESETFAGMKNGLKRISSYIADEDIVQSANSLFDLSKHLSEKIRLKEDSIWSFILRNSYRPLFFRKSFDIIAGNPPWLSYRYISDPSYQKEIKRIAVDEYKLAPKQQKLMTQMELATIFLVHVTHIYLNKGGVLGFVMPRSIFNGDQHDIFRKEGWVAECDITEYWDLKNIAPLFNVPSCVIFSRSHAPKRNDNYPAINITGKLSGRDITLQEAVDFITEKKGKLYLTNLGKKSALSWDIKSGSKISVKSIQNYYIDKFYQGATIVPRNFYFIKKPNHNELAASEFCAETDPEQAKEGKMPWKQIYFKDVVETNFLYRTALSKHILPFHVVDDLPYVLLPICFEDSEFRLKTSKDLKELGFRKIAAWYKKAEDEWEKNRSEKSEKYNLYEWLDYSGKLMKQNPLNRWVVLYNTSGTNLSSAVLDTKRLDHYYYNDAKLYWFTPETKEEAYYLCGIFNTSIINEIIKPFQSAGILGERDIHKTILEIPYPCFDKKNNLHMEIAEISELATKKVSLSMNQGKIVGSLVKKRASARKAVEDEINSINKLTKKLIG